MVSIIVVLSLTIIRIFIPALILIGLGELINRKAEVKAQLRGG
jgi:hypothetical protein